MNQTLDSTITTEGSDSCSPKDRGILVAVRIRPLSSKEVDAGAQVCCEILDGSKIVTISQAGVAGSYLKSQAGTINDYAFDVVFDSSASQMDVYRKTAKPFVQKVLAGLNVTVFAYGATSAGKTHTMFGSSRADEAATHAEAGIIPNAIGDVFKSISAKSESLATGEKWALNLSYIEVYNEQIYDLLVPVPTGKNLSLREDQEKGIVQVAGVIEQKVETLDDVLKLLALGNRNRKTEATMANQVSSRSHAILQLNVIHTRGDKDSTVESKLSLIDLAGSERASATNNKGVRLMEGANINKSLLALANCINALAENSITGKKVNVKYRDSKLTLLLKNSLEGQSNLVIIANINPSHVTLEDSHNTLKYANRAKNIKVNPLSKEIIRDLTWAEREVRLKEENSALRKRVLYLEMVVEDLRNCLGTVEGDRGRERSESSESILVSERSLSLDEDMPDRMSGSFSSSISSYSDMHILDVADDYEASRGTATATATTTTDSDSDTNNAASEDLVESISLDDSDSDSAVGEIRSEAAVQSEDDSISSSGMNFETEVEAEVRPSLTVADPSSSSAASSSSEESSPLEPCWQTVQPAVFMSPSLKRARCQAFENEDEEEDREEQEHIPSTESSVFPVCPAAAIRSLRTSTSEQTEALDKKMKQIDEEVQAYADSMIMKKRRMSAIPTLGRSSVTQRQAALGAKKAPVAAVTTVGRRTLVASGRRSMLKRECATDTDRALKRDNVTGVDSASKEVLIDIGVDSAIEESVEDMDVWSKTDIENLLRRDSGSGVEGSSRRNSSSKRDSSSRRESWSKKDVENLMLKRESVTGSVEDSSKRDSSGKRESWSKKDVENLTKKETVTGNTEGSSSRRNSWSKTDVENIALMENVTVVAPMTRRDSWSKKEGQSGSENVNMNRRDSLGKRESLRLSAEMLLAPLLLQLDSSALRDFSVPPKGDASRSISAFTAEDEGTASSSSNPSSTAASATVSVGAGFSSGAAPTYRARRAQSMGGTRRSLEIEVRTLLYSTVQCSALCDFISQCSS